MLYELSGGVRSMILYLAKAINSHDLKRKILFRVVLLALAHPPGLDLATYTASSQPCLSRTQSPLPPAAVVVSSRWTFRLPSLVN